MRSESEQMNRLFLVWTVNMTVHSTRRGLQSIQNANGTTIRGYCFHFS